jgi:hypothetical protein
MAHKWTAYDELCRDRNVTVTEKLVPQFTYVIYSGSGSSSLRK